MADAGDRVMVTVRTKSGGFCSVQARRLPFGLVLIEPFTDSPHGDQYLIEPNPLLGMRFGTWRGDGVEMLKVVALLEGVERTAVAAA